MLKIKLSRVGKNKQPHYRFVINEAREKRDGRAVDIIGHYAPAQEPKLLSVDMEKYNTWVKKGAQPTDTVRSLVERLKSGNPFPKKKAKLSKKALAKKQAKENPEAAATTPATTPVTKSTAAPAAPSEAEPATPETLAATAPTEKPAVETSTQTTEAPAQAPVAAEPAETPVGEAAKSEVSPSPAEEKTA